MARRAHTRRRPRQQLEPARAHARALRKKDGQAAYVARPSRRRAHGALLHIRVRGAVSHLEAREINRIHRVGSEVRGDAGEDARAARLYLELELCERVIARV